MLSQARGRQGRSGARWMLLALVTAGVQAAFPAVTDAGAYEQGPRYRSDQAAARLYAEIPSAPGMRDDFHRGTVIAEAELDQMRAGFNLGGLDMDFGARLQTRIDNRVELVSVVNFTKAGADIVSRTFSDLSRSASQVGAGTGREVADVTPAAISDLSRSASQVGAGTGREVADVTPAGIDLSGLANFSGLALNDAKGFTAALHNITRNAIVSGVVSNASGRNIQQRLDIDVRLNNVGALKAAKQRASILDSFSGILR